MSVEAQIAESVNQVSMVAFQHGVLFGMVLYSLFLVKHFICDFPLQAFPFMYNNKGDYGHPGGLLHAGIHGAGTLLIVMGGLLWLQGIENTFTFLNINIMCTLALTDMLVHYHIDWAKMRINKAMEWTPTNSEKFWVLMGFDQLLHNLTYVGLIYWFFSFTAV